jgi:hypothetical protein
MHAAALLLALAAMSPGAPQLPRTGDELIRQMHQRYAGKWYQTLTFVQATKFPDGRVQTWYEAMRIPGMLRIDIAPIDSGNAILFRNDSIYQFGRGQQVVARPLVHPLMVLGFDVYADAPEKTIARLKGLNFDLAKVQAGTWQGRNVWIVGTATPGDSTTPQFWVTQDELLFVRLLQRAPNGSINETRFNKYVRLGDGWIAPEVLFFTNGQPGIVEEYSEMKIGMTFAPELFEPARFARPAWVR